MKPRQAADFLALPINLNKELEDHFESMDKKLDGRSITPLDSLEKKLDGCNTPIDSYRFNGIESITAHDQSMISMPSEIHKSKSLSSSASGFNLKPIKPSP